MENKINQLVTSASELKPAAAEVAEAYDRHREKIVLKVNQRMLERPDIIEIVGEINMEMMKDNHADHARFIASILRHFQPETLVETVLWVFRSYGSRGFHSSYWAAQLNVWLTVLKEELPPDIYDSVLPLYNWMIINIPLFTDISEAQLNERRDR